MELIPTLKIDIFSYVKFEKFIKIKLRISNITIIKFEQTKK